MKTGKLKGWGIGVTGGDAAAGSSVSGGEDEDGDWKDDSKDKSDSAANGDPATAAERTAWFELISTDFNKVQEAEIGWNMY